MNKDREAADLIANFTILTCHRVAVCCRSPDRHASDRKRKHDRVRVEGYSHNPGIDALLTPLSLAPISGSQQRHR
ncbi:hypothetical protein D3Y57_02135 (plasmid) [Sphingomonas paeninsulae]|uniref:Uncharacterized protein n=1 Tax=Sphingomonas paeninsulae TaxID=2319844 RepID=A0A494TGE9_SPHPE|nr:hypothetical protein D3Y57_02135 [Sphingomonas paeninsulae]